MESNEQSTNPTDTGSAAHDAQTEHGESEAQQKQTVTDELFSELTVLANRFVDVAQQAWNSEERKRMEADFKKGLNNVAVGLEEGFQKVTESEKTQKAIDRADQKAEEVGDKLRSNQAVNDIAQGLVRGLRSMATILEGWSDEMSAREAARSTQDRASQAGDGPAGNGQANVDPGADEAQDIPIDRSS